MAFEPRSQAETQARSADDVIARALPRPRARPLALVLTGAFAVFAAPGCASSRGDQMKKNLATFQKEQDPDRLIAMAKGFASVGDLSRAEQYLAAALERGADEQKVMPLLMRVCVEEKHYQSAIQYAENYLRKHPNDTATRFVLATLYSAVGQTEDARAQFQKVLEVEPEEADAHFALAVLMRENHEDPVSADRHFREYLRLKPRGPHAEEAQSSLLESVPQ